MPGLSSKCELALPVARFPFERERTVCRAAGPLPVHCRRARSEALRPIRAGGGRCRGARAGGGGRQRLGLLS